jgi:hypothetical protein
VDIFQVSVETVGPSISIGDVKSEVFGNEVDIGGLVFDDFSVSESSIGNGLFGISVIAIVDPYPVFEIVAMIDLSVSVYVVISEIVQEGICGIIVVSVVIQPYSESSIPEETSILLVLWLIDGQSED